MEELDWLTAAFHRCLKLLCFFYPANPFNPAYPCNGFSMQALQQFTRIGRIKRICRIEEFVRYL